MRRSSVLLLALAVVLAVPSAALAGHGGRIVDAAGDALASDPVYVHPGAETSITATEAADMRAAAARAGGGVYVAVLPAAALHGGATPESVIRRLADRLGRPGTFAVVVGGSFRAASNGRERDTAGRLAAEAYREHRDAGAGATLLAFVEAVSAERAGSAGAGEEDDDGADLALLGVLGAAAAGGYAVYAVCRRRRAAAQLAEVKDAAEEDLVALAEDVQGLELDVAMPGVDPRAKDEYEHAVSAYERASVAFRHARAPRDLESVTGAVDDGRYAMASARARLAGREPPERTPPCFFDPRHGPSAATVEWEPPYGEPRPVPACHACALRLERGREPEPREVVVGGERTPWWDAGPAYSGWAGGFFGGATGMLLPALLMGSMLGAGMGFGAGPAYGSDGLGDAYGGDGFGGDGFGDGGGGDFGDFGGGDFGDVGGGDF